MRTCNCLGQFEGVGPAYIHPCIVEVGSKAIDRQLLAHGNILWDYREGSLLGMILYPFDDGRGDDMYAIERSETVIVRIYLQGVGNTLVGDAVDPSFKVSLLIEYQLS